MSAVYSSGKEQALFGKEHREILSLIFNQIILLIFQVEGLYLVKKAIQQHISPLLFLFGDLPYRPITAKLYFVTLWSMSYLESTVQLQRTVLILGRNKLP